MLYPVRLLWLNDRAVCGYVPSQIKYTAVVLVQLSMLLAFLVIAEKKYGSCMPDFIFTLTGDGQFCLSNCTRLFHNERHACQAARAATS